MRSLQTTPSWRRFVPASRSRQGMTTSSAGFRRRKRGVSLSMGHLVMIHPLPGSLLPLGDLLGRELGLRGLDAGANGLGIPGAAGLSRDRPPLGRLDPILGDATPL